MPPMIRRRVHHYAVTLLLGLLAGACAHPPGAPQLEADGSCTPAKACPTCPACPGQPEQASAPPAALPLQASNWRAIDGWLQDDPAQAWPALRTSCSTLSRQAAWKPVCDRAGLLGAAPPSTAARQFFEANFTPWQLTNADGSTQGLVTGYYEPLIRGSRTRSARSAWPIHGVPKDMLTIELGDVYPELKSLRLRGRLVGNKVLPYWNRAQFGERAEQAQAPVLLWADDPIELFFLQVQGSGRVQLPDGSIVRLAYADTNGHPYQSIGRWLADKGELRVEQASMEGIKNWARANPGRLQEMLNANPSYIFFREAPAGNGGPVGALGQPLTEGRSMAVDPRSIPLGAPVFLATSHPRSTQPLQRLMLAQDTGSAIKGGVRGDFYWGFGAEAGALAGRMRQKGEMWVLWPREQVPR